MSTSSKDSKHEDIKKKADVDTEEYEQTIVLPREESRPSEGTSDADDYEATIVLPRSEKESAPPQTGDDDYEATIVLPRSEKQAAPPQSGDDEYEATIVLPRDEKQAAPPQSGNAEYEATIVLPRKDTAPAVDDGAEQTIVLPRKEMAPTTEESAQATIVLPETKRPVEVDDNSAVFEATMTLSKEKLDTKTDADLESYEATAVLSTKQLGMEGGEEDFTVTDMEKVFYDKAVRGGHGKEKYNFTGVIDRGGMGAIFNVLEQDLHRPLAMKVLLPALKADTNVLSSFITEAKITGFLEHPNIVPIHELGLLQQVGIFFTMKFAQGKTLKSIINKIREGAPEDIETYNTYRLLNIFRKVCDAVSFAHSRKVIHLDIKPHNIIVGEYGEVLLMDWGLAKVVGEPQHEPDPVKKEFLADIVTSLKGKKFNIEGSPAFMSPEQANGDFSKINTLTDIFLLGSTLYHMFTCEPPYMDNDIHAILDKAKTRNLIHPATRNPSQQIPEEICRIILKAMAANQSERYQTVEELASDIDDVIAGKWSQQEHKTFAPGEMLMREGEVGEEAYLLLKGTVQVEKEAGGQNIILGTLKEGDIVGEMSVIRKETRSASVEAIEETEVAVLTKEVLYQDLKKLPPYMEKIVSALTQRLQVANTLIHPYATTDCTSVVLKQIRLLFKDKFGADLQRSSIPYQALIDELADDLGIPNPKIERVLEKALRIKLLAREGEHIRIVDLDQLVYYTGHEEKIDQVAHVLNEDQH